MKSAKGPGFAFWKRQKAAWYLSRPRLLTTIIFGVALYLWLRFRETRSVIPNDSYAFLEDESLRDILNMTLGFQKILVLNLPFRTDRRDAMSLAAAASNMKLEFVEGVTGDNIRESAYPPPEENIKLNVGIRGSWRTHMNALQRVVEQNFTSALIFEDDVDWDIRIRQNLQLFALASRFLSKTSSSLSPPRYPVTQVPNPETPDSAFRILSSDNIPSTLPSLPLSSIRTSKPLTPSASGLGSPYGDPSAWDVLWIGHCGAGFPRAALRPSRQDPKHVSTANVVLTHANDATVPLPKYLKAHPFQGGSDPLATAYPPHTRIYHRATGGELCTVAYAVSQRGARRLLHQFGLKYWDDIYDAALGRWCASEDEKQAAAQLHVPAEDAKATAKPHNTLVDLAGFISASKTVAGSSEGKEAETKKKGTEKEGGGGGMERVCLTSQPPLFAHHHPMDGASDIGGLGGGYATKYETKYLRYSVRMNLERIVQGVWGRGWRGGGEGELVDQWPDDE